MLLRVEVKLSVQSIGLRNAPEAETLRRLRFELLLILTLCSSLSAADEKTIYKGIEPDGTVTYSASPFPDARNVEPVQIETFSPEQRRAALILRQEELKKDSTVSARVADWERRLNDADARISSGIRNIAAAEKALKKGRKPLPGERRGIAGGHRRYTDSYFARLSRLETAVEDARKALEKAYEDRNALR